MYATYYDDNTSIQGIAAKMYNARPKYCASIHLSTCCVMLPQVLLPHRRDVKIEGVSVCNKWLTVFERSNALVQAIVHPLPAGGVMPRNLDQGEPLKFDEPAYSLCGGKASLRGV